MPLQQLDRLGGEESGLDRAALPDRCVLNLSYMPRHASLSGLEQAMCGIHGHRFAKSDLNLEGLMRVAGKAIAHCVDLSSSAISIDL
jgi:hypothetical protein